MTLWGIILGKNNNREHQQQYPTKEPERRNTPAQTDRHLHRPDQTENSNLLQNHLYIEAPTCFTECLSSRFFGQFSLFQSTLLYRCSASRWAGTGELRQWWLQELLTDAAAMPSLLMALATLRRKSVTTCFILQGLLLFCDVRSVCQHYSIYCVSAHSL